MVLDLNKSCFTFDSLAGLVHGGKCQILAVTKSHKALVSTKKTQHDSLRGLIHVFHLMVYWRKMTQGKSNESPIRHAGLHCLTILIQ